MAAGSRNCWRLRHGASQKHTDRHGDDEADDHRQGRQLEGDGNRLPERHGDRLVREDRVARTETHHLPEPEQILLVVGLIETEVLAKLRQLLLADVAGLAHERDQRVARHDAHETEDDQRGKQENRHGEQQTPDHVLLHGTVAPSPIASRVRSALRHLSIQARATVGDPYPSVRRSAAAPTLRMWGWDTTKPLSYGIHIRST